MQTILDCTLQSHECRGCGAVREVDGGEHLMLIKGSWASPSFYKPGVCG